MVRRSEGAISCRAAIKSIPASAIRLASIASTGAINIGTGIAAIATSAMTAAILTIRCDGTIVIFL